MLVRIPLVNLYSVGLDVSRTKKVTIGDMTSFIAPPKQIPFYLRIGIWISKRVTGKDLLPARLLAWYPKAAIGSGVLESLVAHKDGNLDERILKLVRMQASFAALVNG